MTSIADYAQLSRSAAKKAAANEKPYIPNLADKKPKNPEIKSVDIHIRLYNGASDNNEELNQLRDYLADNEGRTPVFIHIPVSDGEKTIKARSGLDISLKDEIMQGLKQCKSVTEVWSV